jgi:hypothetical protein
VAHFHDGGACAVKIEQFGLHFFENGQRQGGGTCGEIIDATHEGFHSDKVDGSIIAEKRAFSNANLPLMMDFGRKKSEKTDNLPKHDKSTFLRLNKAMCVACPASHEPKLVSFHSLIQTTDSKESKT